MSGSAPRILTIGSSCINRFQFDFYQERHTGTDTRFVKSFFDWNITSLIGTETVLRLARDEALDHVLRDPALYHVEWDVLIFNRELPGVCFFHEQEVARRFSEPGQIDALISKIVHQAAPFLTPDRSGRTHLVWSNIQPNLPDTVDNVTPWDDFQLTAERYATIKALGTDVFGPDTSFSFLSLEEDMSPELRSASDVTLVDLPRGDAFKGPPDLYDALLTGIVSSSQS